MPFFAHRSELQANPMDQLSRLLEHVRDKEFEQGLNMTLATVGEDGRPSARIVLLKTVHPQGLRFFTNYHSRKGRELDTQGLAAMVFYWPSIDVQARFNGRVERLLEAESDAYFSQRQRDSQLGAWASPQSQVLADRHELERQWRHFDDKFADHNVPRPPHWGGYELRPVEAQFMCRRAHRLHDSFRYLRDENGAWVIDRLAP